MAYPVYMTIGNIPKAVRRKPSYHAQILLGYLPTTKLDHITNAASRRRMLANLFHACMHYILQPLEETGKTGLPMSTGAGLTYRCHPIFAAFVGDYPEQVLVTGVKSGECPKCDIDHDHMGEDNEAFQLRDMNCVLDALEFFDQDPIIYTNACKAAGIKPIIHPFWENLPFVDIFQSITPDILHQGYQGLIKHLLRWLKDIFGTAEIDARCRRLPPNHNIRLFMKGITGLARVSGAEHKQICSILLGIIIDLQLPGGHSSSQLLRCVRAALDFLYLAQYPFHTTKTLDLLDSALQRFNENKSIIIDLGIRDDFKIMKLHFFQHYRSLIEIFGTADGYNTEHTERLHIDLAKDAYRATNHKDEYWQMVLWLERKEKIQQHSNFMFWRMGQKGPLQSKRIPPNHHEQPVLKMTKHPSIKAVSLDTLINDYGATHFREAFAQYTAMTINPGLTSAQLEKKAENIFIPARHLPVYHRIKFADQSTCQVVDSVHVQPQKRTKHGREMQGRFDTVLINDGTGGATGVKGKPLILS